MSSGRSAIATRFGSLACTWQDDGSRLWILGLAWDQPGDTDGPGEVRRLLDTCADPAANRSADFALSLLDWARTTPFRRRVLETLYRDTPAGSVTTYGDLARACGRPGAARAVGGAMHGNPWPVLLPCQRVISADGHLVGYAGTGAAGLERKRALLRHEGVAFRGQRVVG